MVTREQVYDALRECFDPEIPINIVDLGLVYDVAIDEDHVNVVMTLTARGCPAHTSISNGVQQRVAKISGVKSASVQMVWDPPLGYEPRQRRREEKIGPDVTSLPFLQPTGRRAHCGDQSLFDSSTPPCYRRQSRIARRADPEFVRQSYCCAAGATFSAVFAPQKPRFLVSVCAVKMRFPESPTALFPVNSTRSPDFTSIPAATSE